MSGITCDHPELFAAARKEFGVRSGAVARRAHRLHPKEAILLARALEPYRLFFLEDVIALEYLRPAARGAGRVAVPIAVGEQLSS